MNLKLKISLLKNVGIRYSLSSLKNVGNDAIKKIVQIRNKYGEFLKILMIF